MVLSIQFYLWHIFTQVVLQWRSRAPSQCKDVLSGHGDFHYEYRTVVRPSYLYNGNPYTDKTTSSYWDPVIYMMHADPLSIVLWLNVNQRGLLKRQPNKKRNNYAFIAYLDVIITLLSLIVFAGKLQWQWNWQLLYICAGRSQFSTTGF